MLTGGRPKLFGRFVVRRGIRIVAVVAGLSAGIALVLLATDVLLWQRAMGSSDTRFASGSLANGLWKPDQLVPFGAAQALLGVDDDLAYRQAVRAFVLGRPRDEPFRSTELLGQRGQAQDLLQSIADSNSEPRRRAEAANLVGVLGFANAAIDQDQAYVYLSQSIVRFRQAILLDPGSDDAKYNLELALTRLEKTPRPSGQKQQRSSSGGARSGAGTGEPGSGY